MPAPGCRDLPGTKAGQRRATREADKEAGGKRKQEGTGRSQGLRSGKGRGGGVTCSGSRGRVVTWTGRLALRPARSSVRLRSPERGAGRRCSSRVAAGSGNLQRCLSLPCSQARCSSLPAERLVHCLSLAACVVLHSGTPAFAPSLPERFTSQASRYCYGPLPLTVIFGRLIWD